MYSSSASCSSRSSGVCDGILCRSPVSIAENRTVFQNSAQAALGILIEPVAASVAIELGKTTGQDACIGAGEVHALGAGGGNDVGGIAREEQTAILHWRSHKGADPRDVLLNDWSFNNFPALLIEHADVQFLPESRV